MDYLYSKDGIILDGYDSITDISQLSGFKGKNIFLYIDMSVDNISYLKELSNIIRNNSVYLIMDSLNVERDTVKLLFISSLVVYENYNIYLLGGEELTTEYLGNVRENRVNRIDFKMYVDKCVDSLLHLSEDLDKMDLEDGVSNLGKVHIKNMLGLYKLDLVDTYKKQVDTLQLKIVELQTTKLEVNLANSVSSNNVKLNDYTTLNVNMFNNNLGGVLYFKEYTNVLYINSLIEYYITLITSGMYNKKVKLIVFDDLHDLNALYEGFTIVVGEHINRDLGKYLESNKLLITERSTALLELILKDLSLQDHIILIYDRMHGIKDMVVGGAVVKYSLFSGKGSFDKIRARFKSIEFGTNIISNREIVDNGIVLRSMANYGGLTSSRKSAMYNKYQYKQGGKKDEYLIFRRFNSDLGIVKER